MAEQGLGAIPLKSFQCTRFCCCFTPHLIWVPGPCYWNHSGCWCQSHTELCASEVKGRTEIGGGCFLSINWRGRSVGLFQLKLPIPNRLPLAHSPPTPPVSKYRCPTTSESWLVQTICHILSFLGELSSMKLPDNHFKGSIGTSTDSITFVPLALKTSNHSWSAVPSPSSVVTFSGNPLVPRDSLQ